MEYTRPNTRLPKSPAEKAQWRRVIIVLEHCPLEQVLSDRGGWELLCDKHKRTLAKRNIDPADFRPDVVHHALLHLLDSPLNRAGMLQIFIRTQKGVLISVDPRMRIPRSPRLFSKMMAMLLYKLKVRASQATSRVALMKVVKNPITDHLPSNTKFVRVERDGELVDVFAFCAELAHESTRDMKTTGACNGLPTMPSKKHRTEDGDGAPNDTDADDDDLPPEPVWDRATPQDGGEEEAFHPFAFVVGGISRGDVEVNYATEAASIRLANRGMSAAAAVSLLCHGFEEAWLNTP